VDARRSDMLTRQPKIRSFLSEQLQNKHMNSVDWQMQCPEQFLEIEKTPSLSSIQNTVMMMPSIAHMAQQTKTKLGPYASK